jgi:RNA-directed DNA polymerase
MANSRYEMVRYADDFVILCQTQAQAQHALELVQQWTTQVGLTLHPDKTHIADAVEDGFEFLGYRFRKGNRYVWNKSLKKLRQAIRERTGRSQGRSMEAVITSINPVLRGWFNYFKHSHRYTFDNVDKWVRMRLRSILRKNMGKRGRGRGSDHQRWPNACFSERGLYSLKQAYAQASQSMKMAH